MDLDGRLVMILVWGVGSVWVWGANLRNQYRVYRRLPDVRSRRELVEAGSLFIVAAASCLSVMVLLLGQVGMGMRGFFVALALGAFFAAGFYSARDRPR